MGIVDSFTEELKLTLEGRTSRKNFWIFTILSFLIEIFAIVAGAVFFTELSSGVLKWAVVITAGLVVILLNIYSFCVCVRRFHDIGRSGWWVLGFVVLASVFSSMSQSPIGDIADAANLVLTIIFLAFCSLESK